MTRHPAEHAWRCAAVVTALCAMGAKRPNGPWKPPETRPQDRAIIDAATAARPFWKAIVAGPNFWTPALPEVVALEQRLPEYLRRQLCDDPPVGPQYCGFGRVPLWLKAPLYRRQYVGIFRGERRVIRGNFFCETHRNDWRTEPVVVFDGGDCFFQLDFDPKSGAFSNLIVNNEA